MRKMKNGLWRVAQMTNRRHERWREAYRQWYDVKGYRLAVSPEMWMQ